MTLLHEKPLVGYDSWLSIYRSAGEGPGWGEGGGNGGGKGMLNCNEAVLLQTVFEHLISYAALFRHVLQTVTPSMGRTVHAMTIKFLSFLRPSSFWSGKLEIGLTAQHM